MHTPLVIIHITTGKSYKIRETIKQIYAKTTYGSMESLREFTLENNKVLVIPQKHISHFHEH